MDDDDDLVSSTMDVIIFEPETGTEFTIGIGYFDTALEIKLKIQEHRNIPISRQTLTFNGKILLDDNGVIDCMIFENSRISLTIAPDQINVLLILPTSSNMPYSALQIDANAKIHQLKEKILLMDIGMRDFSINQIVLRLDGTTELSSDEKTLCDCNITDLAMIEVTVEVPTISTSSRSSLKRPRINIPEEEPSAPPQSVQINLLIEISSENVQYSCLEFNLDDKIHQVKQKILTMDGMMNVTINQITLVLDGMVFLSGDEKTLRDYDVMDGAKINVIIEPSPTSSGINSSPEKVRFLVSSRCGTTKMEVEMNELDKVEELRKVLEKQINFPLPQEGYFFIHKNNVMENDKSFRLHQVRYGDTIDVYPIASSENHPINLDIFDDPPVNLEGIFSAPPPYQSDQISVLIKLPSKFGLYSRLDVGANDKIQQLKQMILKMDVRMSSVTINHIVLRLTGTTELLQDEKTLRDCDIMDGAKIDVTIKATPTSSSTGSGSAIIDASPTNSNSGSGPATRINSSPKRGLNKVRFEVVSKCGTRKIEVEMNIFDHVEELRKVLEKQNFPVPREGYFFIHKQAPMDDDKSFRWHRVDQGDTIDVFPGWLSNGP